MLIVARLMKRAPWTDNLSCCHRSDTVPKEDKSFLIICSHSPCETQSLLGKATNAVRMQKRTKTHPEQLRWKPTECQRLKVRTLIAETKRSEPSSSPSARDIARDKASRSFYIRADEELTFCDYLKHCERCQAKSLGPGKLAKIGFLKI